jgi:hypothetical protein|tara:strand:- start:244 stop:507 length:264 start_codon:yes stop_codon:yes gene_type:complete
MVKVESWGYLVALLAVIVIGTNFVANTDTVGRAYGVLSREDTRCSNGEAYVTCLDNLRDAKICDEILESPQNFPNMAQTDFGYEGCA